MTLGKLKSFKKSSVLTFDRHLILPKITAMHERSCTKCTDLFVGQLHNLESILGDLRGSSSDFYPDQGGGGGAGEAGNKPQGCLEDGLQGVS